MKHLLKVLFLYAIITPWINVFADSYDGVTMEVIEHSDTERYEHEIQLPVLMQSNERDHHDKDDDKNESGDDKEDQKDDSRDEKEDSADEKDEADDEKEDSADEKDEVDEVDDDKESEDDHKSS